MNDVRERFVAVFGEDQALKIEQAADEHRNGVHDDDGGDRFRWALVIAIGHDCMVHPGYREHHGITADADQIKAWVFEHGGLRDYTGDLDYLAALAGAYDGWYQAPEKEEQ